MERKEFEQILKRALELQSLQKNKVADEDFNAEDLVSAATRLGIDQDVLDKAITETGTRFKRFHLAAPPDVAKEAFIKHFLMQETNSSSQHKPIRIDHNTIDMGSNKAIRVFHPHSSSAEALVEFSSDGTGGTNVTWTGNYSLDLTSKLMILGWPFAIMGVIGMANVMNGVALLSLLSMWPVFLIFFLTSLLMYWGIGKSVFMLEDILVSYFQNCQTLDEIQTQTKVKNELENYRRKEQQELNQRQKDLLQQPLEDVPEEVSDSEEDLRSNDKSEED